MLVLMLSIFVSTVEYILTRFDYHIFCLSLSKQDSRSRPERLVKVKLTRVIWIAWITVMF